MSKRFNEDSRVKIPTLLHLTRLGYNYLSIHGKEKPTWDEENNIFTDIFKARVQQNNPDLSELEVEESKYNIQASYAFINWMKKGDIVLISRGNKVVDAIGVVMDEYKYDADAEFHYVHSRKVKWIANDLDASPKLFIDKNISQQSIYRFDTDDVKIEAFKKMFTSTPSSSEKKNYVLIIDEINRANVSSVFGELITLLEPDKRLGQKEALKIVLPYSKEEFSVPDNLYVVGTMNTADRSVEALDTALRRRFSFIEKMPQEHLLSPSAMYCRLLWEFKDVKWEDKKFKTFEDRLLSFLGASEELFKERYDIWEKMEKEKDSSIINYFDKFTFSGFNLKNILEKINGRIELLLDRDHTIGHSYFINVYDINDLKLTFKDKIIPLLQEYFYGDYGKIGLVLGDGFVNNIEPDENIFAEFEYPGSEGLVQSSFSLIPFEDINFEHALNKLFNN